MVEQQGEIFFLRISLHVTPRTRRLHSVTFPSMKGYNFFSSDIIPGIKPHGFEWLSMRS